jgi:RimJ/RimL family protein N-acetyltransferase
MRKAFEADEDYTYLVILKNNDGTEGTLVGACGIHRRSTNFPIMLDLLTSLKFALDVALTMVKTLELGYWLDHRQRGKGFASELAKALVRVCFRVEDVRIVIITCDVNNVASASTSGLKYQLRS